MALVRVRYQFLLGIILSCILPMMLRGDFDLRQFLGVQTQINAAIASAVAVTVGFYFFHKLTRFPGVVSISYIFPIFSITFGVMFVIFFFGRIEYSRFIFGTSYLICQAWFHFVFLIGRRIMEPSFAIVPGGDASTMTEIPFASWTMLTTPALRTIPRSGIVADLRADLSDEWERFIADSALMGIPVYHYKQIKESLTGKVEIEHLSENTLGSLLPNGVYSLVKEVVDRLISWALLPILLPIFAIVAVLIKLESKGPIFYRQERIGFRGRPFKVWKFRTMKDGSDLDPADRAAASTKKDDPRITKVGRVLRRTRLDELPQVFNIINGEMSWIGPRPEPVVLSSWFEQELPFYRYRHIVKPGITGWAQVNQGYVVGVEAVLRKLHYDFYYIKNYSVWIDLVIIVKTVRTILTGHGAR